MNAKLRRGLVMCVVASVEAPLVFELRPHDAWSRAPATGSPSAAHLVDTTMLFAPRSGGVKRYLLAKRAWLAEHRPRLRHTLLTPGDETRAGADGHLTLAAVRLPFGDGYRWPASTRRWADGLVALGPTVIEAGDPYAPGRAALEAGDRLGIPVVGFCHSDPAALAALHLGEWAEPPVRRRWARLFRRFDRVVAPSRHIAERLAQAGVPNVRVVPLGVDVEVFNPQRADREALRTRLGLGPDVRLLVFAGRPAREKNVDVMLDAVARLGARYHLLLIGAGVGARPQDNASCLDFEPDPREVARLLASCDAFLHANPNEPFGLVALEAMACGLPVVSGPTGGVAEFIDDSVGCRAVRADADALAEAVVALFEAGVEVRGAAARARARTRHGWGATFETLTALYAELSRDAGPSASLAAAERGWTPAAVVPLRGRDPAPRTL